MLRLIKFFLNFKYTEARYEYASSELLPQSDSAATWHGGDFTSLKRAAMPGRLKVLGDIAFKPQQPTSSESAEAA